MKYASDFRTEARNALKGKWGIAVLAGLVASILGAGNSGGPSISFNYSENGAHASFSLGGQTLVDTSQGIDPQLQSLLIGGMTYIIIAVIVVSVAWFLLSGVVRVGYAQFNLNLIDQKEAVFDVLFSRFPQWKNIAISNLLVGLYTLLWSLLFIIPGIIASYSYSMVPFLLADYPELTAKEAIEHSKRLMTGNRWRLFCLEMSFLGWVILTGFTLGIGNLWLLPYTQTSRAAFYREISGTHSPEINTEPDML